MTLLIDPGKVLSIPLAAQIDDGESGYLVSDTRSIADRLSELVQDAGLAIELGTAGRAKVQEEFLITRLLEDELRLLESVSGGATVTS